MAGITVDTGKTQSNSSGAGRRETKPFKVLVLANLSGCRHRQHSVKSIAERKFYRLDKDNFDEIFSRIGVAVTLPLLNQTLQFSDFDNLNPDYLFEELDVFNRYRQRIRQLKSKDHWREAVEALSQEGLVATAPLTPEAKSPAVVGTTNFLDELISQTEQVHQQSFSVDALIRQTVAPYVEEKIDVNLDDYVKAVETAAADLLRSILHSSEFREIETHWRSIDLLNRRLDTDKSCQLHIVDIGREELMAEAAIGQAQLTSSTLYQTCVEANATPGSQHFDAIVYGDFLQCNQQDQVILSLLSGLATACDAQLFCGLGHLPFGPGGIAAWAESTHLLQGEIALENLKAAVHGPSFICVPRFMVRLPYGNHTRPIDSIGFEELPLTHPDTGYLWGNGAYLAILAKALWYQRGDSELSAIYIDNLPTHITRDEDGDEKIVPPTEIYLTEQLLQRFAEAGLLSLQSVKNSDKVLLGNWREFSV